MKEFTTYYYNIHKLGEIDKELLFHNLNQKIGNRDGYEIKKISDDKFFIHWVTEHQFDLLPKKGSDSDITQLKPLELEDGEGLFSDIFVYLDISCLNIFSGSIGVISVLKAGKEASNILLGKLFEEIYSLDKACNIHPITYRDNEKYIKALNKINGFSFSIASANMQRALGVVESDGIDDIYKIKEKLGGDVLNFYVGAKEGLSKNKIMAFYSTYRHIFTKSPKISVDEVGKHINQEIDKIRFKSTIQIELENGQLNFDSVMLKMQEDFNTEIKKIKEEYNYTS